MKFFKRGNKNKKFIVRDDKGKPVECDCGEWPGPCDGSGWCQVKKREFGIK